MDFISEISLPGTVAVGDLATCFSSSSVAIDLND